MAYASSFPLASAGPEWESDGEGLVVLCLEAGESATEPMCSTAELQQELVPYVLSHLLQKKQFLKLSKEGRKARVKELTQQMLGGRSGGEASAEEEAGGLDLSPASFWAHLRSKYGTRQGHLLETLGHIEPWLRSRRVVTLRFEAEVEEPSSSLLVRASASAAGTAPLDGAENSAAAPPGRLEFPPGQFNATALGAWMDASGCRRFAPLWNRLSDECRQRGALPRPLGAALVSPPASTEQVLVLLLCIETGSTDTAPAALAIAGHVLHRRCERVPCLSSVTFGSHSSERLAALEELCAWAGGLSINVNEPSMMKTAADCLAAHLFSDARGGRDMAFEERRKFHSMKQKLGTCFLALPAVTLQGSAPEATTVSHQIASSATHLTKVEALSLERAVRHTNLQDLLERNDGCCRLDGTTPSDRMLAVLADTSLAILRRWSRGLRCWREHRGLRDVVFAEPGGLGLELQEPLDPCQENESEVNASRRQWTLKATHPPASALKMESGSVLVAINQTRVRGGTLRSEVSRRSAMRPVSFTFAAPAHEATKEPRDGIDFAAVFSEIAVAELREGFRPIAKATPPLSVALQRVADARRALGTRDVRCQQALRLLCDVAAFAAPPEVVAPAFAREPAVLYRVLLFSGGVLELVRCGMLSKRCHALILSGARRSAPPSATRPSSSLAIGVEGGAGVVRRLWTWTIRFGKGPPARRRLSFWRWLLACTPTVPRAALGESPVGGGTDPPRLAVIASALRVDAAGLLQLAAALGGIVPGVSIAAAFAVRLATTLSADANGSRNQDIALPRDLLEALLREPFHMQRVWSLTVHSLPWLMREGRSFQVMLAAACPDLFRHLVAEGVPPELFYFYWLQILFHGVLQQELRLHIVDMFLSERSYKVVVRVSIALFALLEQRLRRCDVDGMMKILLQPQGWDLDPGAVVAKMHETKVTRAMLRSLEAADDAADGR